MRILIVDGDVRGREVLLQRLRGRGVEADSAQTAAEAIDMISMASYDFVLLEPVMPRNASLEILTWMDKLPSPPRCIVMSGIAQLWRRANPDAKIAGILQKPFAIEDLLRLIG